MELRTWLCLLYILVLIVMTEIVLWINCDLSVQHLHTCHMLSSTPSASLVGLLVRSLALDYGKWILSEEYNLNAFAYSPSHSFPHVLIATMCQAQC